MSVDDYLQIEFDLRSLTVPRLRSILVKHDIPYPSGALRPALMDIFTEKVLGQRDILIKTCRAKRTSRGITNADTLRMRSTKTDQATALFANDEQLADPHKPSSSPTPVSKDVTRRSKDAPRPNIAATPTRVDAPGGGGAAGTLRPGSIHNMRTRSQGKLEKED